MGSKHRKEERRPAQHASRIVTRIWQEEPLPENPYLAGSCRCHGYDILELMRKRSFADVLFLLLNGELPTSDQSKLLETLMIGLINPGPRHPATWAAMNTAIGRTNPAHILPISMAVLGGDHLGGGQVDAAIRFLRKEQKNDPANCAAELLNVQSAPDRGDWQIAPGFGSRYGGIDPLPQSIASEITALSGSGPALKWGCDFAGAIKNADLGWLTTGVAAAVFCDLGFHPRAGAGLFQLISGPGLLAHGLEMANEPITAMPFLDEEHYVIAEKARKKKD